MTMTVEELIKQQLQNNNVLLYMKGTPSEPQCGFSAQAISMLNDLGVEYATVDVLANPKLRSTVKEVTSWPTFPQLHVEGELIGGCDIMMNHYQSGELKQILADFIKQQ